MLPNRRTFWYNLPENDESTDLLSCRSELIDSAWVVIVTGQKCIKNKTKKLTIDPVSRNVSQFSLSK